jgi:hypothetical protein
MEEFNILNVILNAALTTDSGESPYFARKCDRQIIIELQNLISKAGESTENLADKDSAVRFTEQHAEALLDCICKTQRTYMEIGIKIGTKAVLQILGL